MRTVTIKFKANNKKYVEEFPWEGTDLFLDNVKAIYKKLGIKKATCQEFKISSWWFWCGYKF